MADETKPEETTATDGRRRSLPRRRRAAPAPAAARAAKPAAPRPPAAPLPDLAGKTTTAASAGGAAAADGRAGGREAGRGRHARSRRHVAAADPPRLDGPRVGRVLGGVGRRAGRDRPLHVPNVLNEPPQQFKAGFPNEYGMGVDERWKEKFGIWIVRTPDDIEQHASGFYALIIICTHLGCTPNYLSAENKFKCPCHGSGFRTDRRQLRRARRRARSSARASCWPTTARSSSTRAGKFQCELGQWTDPEAFLKA